MHINTIKNIIYDSTVEQVTARGHTDQHTIKQVTAHLHTDENTITVVL